MTYRHALWIVFLGAAVAVAAPVPKQPTVPYVKWTVKPESERNAMNAAVAVKDLVVVAIDKGELQAYRSDDGKSIWAYDHGKRIYHKLSADDERVYFTAKDGVTAVKCADGKRAWSFEVAHGDGPVLASKGNVFFADNDGTLFSLDAKTGKQLWSTDFLADAPADPPGFVGNDARIAPCKARPYNLVTDGETLYLNVFDQCRLIAFNAADGKKKWSFSTQGWVGGSAASNATHVFIGSQDSHIYGIDKKSGKEVWKFMTTGRADTGIAADAESVYFGSSNGSFFCLNQKDGKERWIYKVEQKSVGIKNSIYCEPILRNGLVHVLEYDGQIKALSPESGKVVWKIHPDPDSRLSGTLATDGKSFYVMTHPQMVLNGQPAPMPPGVAAILAISLK